MIEIIKSEGCAKSHQGRGPGALLVPSNPLHHFVVNKPSQIVNPAKVTQHQYDEHSAITNWVSRNDDVLKALMLDPDKVKAENMKADGYDEEYLCIGVGSKQYSGKHILFLDLDNTTKEQSERTAKSLISSVGCSDCYIVQSSVGSHHLVCFDMFSFLEVQKIARDFGHIQWAKFRGEAKDFVLRIGPKMKVMKSMRPDGDKVFLEEVNGTQPKLVSIIRSPFKYRNKSNSMRRVFSSVWGFNIKKDVGFTDSTMYRFHCYRVRLKLSKSGEKLKDVDFKQQHLKPAAQE